MCCNAFWLQLGGLRRSRSHLRLEHTYAVLEERQDGYDKWESWLELISATVALMNNNHKIPQLYKLFTNNLDTNNTRIYNAEYIPE